MSILIVFNGNPVELSDGSTLEVLLSSRGLSAQPLVLEYNGDVLSVPVDAEGLVLADGDAINCFRVVAGG